MKFYRILDRSTGLIVATLFKTRIEAQRIKKLYEKMDNYKESLLEIQEVFKWLI